MSQRNRLLGTKARGRRGLLWILLAIGAAAGLAIMILVRGSDGPAAQPPPVGATLTPGRASELQQGLASGDPQALASIVAGVAGSAIDATAARELASLRLSIDPDSFKVTDDLTGTVDMTESPPHGAQHTWVVALVMEDGQWKIASTRRLS